MARPVGDDEIVQPIVHPALRPAFWEWLASRGLRFGRISLAGEDDEIPSFAVFPEMKMYPVRPDRYLCHLREVGNRDLRKPSMKSTAGRQLMDAESGASACWLPPVT